MQQPVDPLFRALADPTRRALFERLCAGGELTVGALTGPSGVSQPVVSRHLRHLREAGLVTGRHAGRETYYSAAPVGLAPLDDWTRGMTAFWERRVDALADLLDRMDR